MNRPWAKVLLAAPLVSLLCLLAPSTLFGALPKEFKSWASETGVPYKELLKRAEAGDVPAALEVAILCYEPSKRRGAPHDEKEAVKWFKVVAEHVVDGKSELMIGLAYQRGEGVEKNAIEAMKWIKRSAEHGEPAAQLMYGMTCALGTDGVPKSKSEAQKWFEKAAETGDPILPCHAGLFHFFNAVHDGPPTPHATNAVIWLRKAAEQGQKDAQFALGVCYHGGIGVKKDLAEAYKWESLAARGNPNKAIAQDLVSDISMSELREGMHRAVEFIAHPSGIETFMVPRWITPLSSVPTSQSSEP